MFLTTGVLVMCLFLVVVYIIQTDVRNLKIVPDLLEAFPVYDRNSPKKFNDTDTLKQAKPFKDIIPYPPANAKKYFIYSCVSGLCGGLSDREKGMIISYIIAYVTDRKFGIEVTIPDENCTFPSFYDENKITWNIKRQELAGLSSITVGRRNNKTFITTMKTIDFDELLTSDVVYFKANLHYWNSFSQNKIYSDKLGPMVNLTEDQIYANILPRILPLGDRLKKQLDDFLLIARPRKDSRLVCGHLRKAKNPMDLEGAHEVFLFLKQFMSNKNNRIFIASDTPTFKDLSAKMFPEQYVNVTRDTLHVERLINASNICNGFEMAILEQRILSKCDVLLIAFSGYSRLAAYIRNKNEGLYCYKYGVIKTCRTDELLKVYGLPNK